MSTAADSSPIEIRDVRWTADMRAVERLQGEVWGIPDLDVVPLYQLVAAQASGGIVLGAFVGNQLVGFAYGFVGLERGRTVHHSHMLAVKKEYRSRNLGYRLKLEQRARAIDQGIDIMTWTFDPLQSLNASFNLGKLGVVADRYYPDFYGSEAASFLHRNGTDRLWVSWHLSSPRVTERIAGGDRTAEAARLPALVTVCETGAPISRHLRSVKESERFVIEIPRDISKIESEDPQLASNWRLATREAFTAALGAGFVVEDFVIADRSGQQVGLYILDQRDELKLW